MCHTRSAARVSVSHEKGGMRRGTHDGGTPTIRLSKRKLERQLSASTRHNTTVRTVIGREADDHPVVRRDEERVAPDGVHLVQRLPDVAARRGAYAVTNTHARGRERGNVSDV